jgi:flavin reductase (DIM6/NTAB) family NADH-FMN oxidoreductase RutF
MAGEDLLPYELIRALDDARLTDAEQPAFLLVTGDEDGAPRISMVSAGELLALDERTLRVALWRGTRSAANLARGGTVLFGAVSPGSVIYVRAKPDPLVVPEPAELECFELTVTEVRADVHAGMPVTSGITFRTDEPEQAATDWRRQRQLLANARRPD